jgi:hypothetical protein
MPLFEGPHLKKYWQEKGFDLGALLHDDFLVAIKKLYNEQHYPSALKLLLSLIDTMAYFEHGDSPRSFQRWLTAYVDLSGVGVTPDELWEHRNALLHMSTLDSRKVTAQTVTRLLPYVGQIPAHVPLDYPDYKVYPQLQLHVQVGHGIARFIEALNKDRTKLEPFLTRYEDTLSDTHYTRLETSA